MKNNTQLLTTQQSLRFCNDINDSYVINRIEEGPMNLFRAYQMACSIKFDRHNIKAIAHCND